MKNKISWRRRKKNADRSVSTVQPIRPIVELFSQAIRIHSVNA